MAASLASLAVMGILINPEVEVILISPLRGGFPKPQSPNPNSHFWLRNPKSEMPKKTYRRRVDLGGVYKDVMQPQDVFRHGALRVRRYHRDWPGTRVPWIPLRLITQYGQYDYDAPGDRGVIEYIKHLDKQVAARKAEALRRLQPWIIRNVSNTVNYGSSDWEYK